MITTYVDDLTDSWRDATEGGEAVEPHPFQQNEHSQSRYPCCSRSRRSCWILFGSLLLLVIAITGIAVAFNDRPSAVDLVTNSTGEIQVKNQAEEEALLSTSRQENGAYYGRLRQALISQLYNGSYNPYIFLNPNSPQKLAMEWMAYVDTLHLPVGEASANSNSTMANVSESSGHSMENFRWVQRYALITMYFANGLGLGGVTMNNDTETNGTAALASTSWATQVGVHECQWGPTVACDDQERITSISLARNVLTSTIPREIGLLTSLRHLNMSGNLLTGSLPRELYGLTHLGTFTACVAVTM